jgi:hypothetical protein
MKWDWEKTIHQELVGKIKWIKVEIDILIELYPNVLNDIKNVPTNIEEIQKEDWQVVLYHEMSE